MVFYCLLLFFLGLIIFYKTFHLSIMGDEWQMIWIIKSSILTTGQWDWGIKQFHWQGYQFGAFLMHLLTDYFGYDGKAVYVFSYITRFLAGLTLFYFLIKRGCSRKIAFLGSIFFLLTPIGIQATDWVKNFTSYISIIFFIMCIDFSHYLKSWKKILIFISTFAIAVYVNPIRAPGIILTIFLLLLLNLFLDRAGSRKKIVLSMIGLALILIAFSKSLVFANVDGIRNYYIEHLWIILGKTLSGNLDRIGDLFILIGRGILPETSLIYISLLVVILLFWKRYLFDKIYFTIILIIHAILIFGVLFILPSSKEKMTAILGIYFTLFLLSTFIIEILRKKSQQAMDTMLPLLLNVSFIITAWIFGNTDITDSSHRYLIYPALSLPIIIAFSLKQNNFADFKGFLLKPLRMNSLLFCSVIALFIVSFFSVKSEINKMYISHNQETSNLLWGQILPYFEDFDFVKRRPIILFESDNPALLLGTVVFGIDYKLGFLNNVWEESRLPIPVDSLEALKSMLTDGKASKRYTGKEIIFPKEDAFYFQIKNNQVRGIDISTLFPVNK